MQLNCSALHCHAVSYFACCIHALQVWNVKQELAPLSDSFLSCGVSTVMITVLRIRNATVWQVFISIDLLRADLISNCFGCEHSATGSNSQRVEVLLVVASAGLSVSINAGTAWHASKLRSPWTRFWKRHGFGSTYGSASVTLEGDWKLVYGFRELHGGAKSPHGQLHADLVNTVGQLLSVNHTWSEQYYFETVFRGSKWQLWVFWLQWHPNIFWDWSKIGMEL